MQPSHDLQLDGCKSNLKEEVQPLSSSSSSSSTLLPIINIIVPIFFLRLQKWENLNDKRRAGICPIYFQTKMTPYIFHVYIAKCKLHKCKMHNLPCKLHIAYHADCNIAWYTLPIAHYPLHHTNAKCILHYAHFRLHIAHIASTSSLFGIALPTDHLLCPAPVYPAGKKKY